MNICGENGLEIEIEIEIEEKENGYVVVLNIKMSVNRSKREKQ